MPRPQSACRAAVRVAFALLFCKTLYLVLFLTKSSLIWHQQIDLGETKKRNDGINSTDATWQPVYGSRHKFYVYSAFVELRALEMTPFLKPPAVRIIGVARIKRPEILEDVVCRFWFADRENEVTALNSRELLAKAAIVAIREHWDLDYSACFIFCPIANKSRVPDAVSVYANENIMPFLKGDLRYLPEAGNTILINDPNTKNIQTEGIAACVKPLHSNFVEAWRLVEWIELNRIIGISHFHFYHHESSLQLKCVLDEYVRRGVATMLDWKNLPLVSQIEVRTENMFSALNDCLYRHMFSQKFMTFIDIDEYVVVKKNESLLSLLRRLTEANADVASFVFRNAFFYLQWPDDPSYEGLDLVTQKKTQRIAWMNEAKNRSKYICRPEMVSEVGNHFLWETTERRFSQAIVQPATASLHHYRNCEFGGESCVDMDSVRDTTLWVHQDELHARLKAIEPLLEKKCQLEPLKKIKLFF